MERSRFRGLLASRWKRRCEGYTHTLNVCLSAMVLIRETNCISAAPLLSEITKMFSSFTPCAF